MLTQFSRTELLLGKEGMERLKNARVAVFGVGGVGGYVCEAVGKATNISFAKAKIIVDITLIVIAVVCGYFYFGTWQCQVVDTETLMSMIIVGVMMKLFDKHLDWFSQ